MMKRFSRKRRGSADNRNTTIDASTWMEKISEQGIVEAGKLEPWTEAGVPDRVAAVGRGERSDGSSLIVAFSPNSTTEAILGGLAAAQHAVESSGFAGELLIVAPQWPAKEVANHCSARDIGALQDLPTRAARGRPPRRSAEAV